MPAIAQSKFRDLLVPPGRDGGATQRVAQIAKIEVAVTCDRQKLARSPRTKQALTILPTQIAI